MPALRERYPDTHLLAHHFLDFSNQKLNRKIKGFTNAAMDLLCAYGWSGNVRELENEIERAVALAGDVDTISEEMLSEYIRGGPEARTSHEVVSLGAGLNTAVDDLKRHMIRQAMSETGSKTGAAEKLGIPRQSLQKMMKRLDLND